MLRHHRIIPNSTRPLQLRSASDTIRHCRTGCPIHLEQPSQQACGEATKRGPRPPRLRIRTQSVAGGSSSFTLPHLVPYRCATDSYALESTSHSISAPSSIETPRSWNVDPPWNVAHAVSKPQFLVSRLVLRKRREGVVPYLPTLSHSDLCRLFLPRLVCLSTVRLARRRQTVSGPEDPPFRSHPPFPLDWAALPIPSPSPHGS